MNRVLLNLRSIRTITVPCIKHEPRTGNDDDEDDDVYDDDDDDDGRVKGGINEENQGSPSPHYE